MKSVKQKSVGMISLIIIYLSLFSMSSGAGSFLDADRLYSNKDYQMSIDVDAAYFWLDDVGGVFSGEKDWDSFKVKVEDINPEKHFYTYAVVVRVKNNGGKPAWGALEIRSKIDATNEILLEVPSIEPTEPWSLFVITFRQRLLLKDYVVNGPYVNWAKLSTI